MCLIQNALILVKLLNPVFTRFRACWIYNTDGVVLLFQTMYVCWILECLNCLSSPAMAVNA